MTAPDPADTVAEQAAQIIRDAKSYRSPDGIRDRATAASLDLKHAGLLADPADRELRGDNNALRVTVKVHDAARRQAEARAERAEADLAAANDLLDRATQRYEAEVAELRATVARVATLRDRWAILAGQAMNADTREWLYAASKSLRAALDGVGEQP